MTAAPATGDLLAGIDSAGRLTARSGVIEAGVGRSGVVRGRAGEPGQARDLGDAEDGECWHDEEPPGLARDLRRSRPPEGEARIISTRQGGPKGK